MKRNIVCYCLLFALVWLIQPKTISAHLSGPPYVKLNGIYADTNPLLTYTTPLEFEIGSDLASPSGYIVNEPVTFEIDEQFFPNPYAFGPEPVTPLYRWTFGDGSEKKTGRSVTHTYTKPGTYFPKLEAKFPGKVEEYAEVDPIQISILPHRGYEPPVAKIKVNNKLVGDPTKEIIDVRSGKTITLDASSSTGSIVTYMWDFSDETYGRGKIVSHRYKNSDYFPMFPILRVVDSNNIISDTFVFLDSPRSTNIFVSLWGAVRDFFESILGWMKGE